MRATKMFSKIRHTTLFLLCLMGLNLSACSTAGQGSGSWFGSAPVDLSKLHVLPFGVSVDARIPIQQVNAARSLTHIIQTQLYEKNRLQTDTRFHSLILKGVILRYQGGVLEVQGEIYDGEKFLAYSRVQQALVPDEDWRQGLWLLSERLLATLLDRMTALQPAYGAGFVGYRNSYYDRYYSNHYYYDDWGYWHRPYIFPAENYTPPPRDTREIIKALPRSGEVRTRWETPSSSEKGFIYTPPQSHGTSDNQVSRDFIPPQSQSYPHDPSSKQQPTAEPKTLDQAGPNIGFETPREETQIHGNRQAPGQNSEAYSSGAPSSNVRKLPAASTSNNPSGVGFSPPQTGRPSHHERPASEPSVKTHSPVSPSMGTPSSHPSAPASSSFTPSRSSSSSGGSNGGEGRRHHKRGE